MAGMSWIATTADVGGEAKLAFGAPNTDNVVLMMSCQPRSGRIAVSTLESAAIRTPVMTLTSRDRSSKHAALAMPNQLGDGALVEAQAPAADPTLTRFAETGELAVAVNGRRLSLPGATRAEARRFVDSCRA
jgi:hypothetical protein